MTATPVLGSHSWDLAMFASKPAVRGQILKNLGGGVCALAFLGILLFTNWRDGQSAAVASGTSASQQEKRPNDNDMSGKPADDLDSPGWHVLPNTKLASVCMEEPNIQATEGCSAVIADWNSGIADVKRNRLVFWGGGHAGYAGNELYAVDLNEKKVLRLTDPSLPPAKCIAALTNPTGPNSRHTYNGLAYIADSDQMFVTGGAVYRANDGCQPSPDPEFVGYGGRMNDTWTFDFGSSQWARRDPTKGKGRPATGYPNLGEGIVADYDPVTKKVYVGDTAAWFSYETKTNTYAELNHYATFSYQMSGAIDPEKRLFVLFGGGMARAYDLKHNTLNIWDKQTVGCFGLQEAGYPGVAYDSKLKKIVGWAGGDAVYVFDADKKDCTKLQFPNGPGKPQQAGTLGRFRYFPSLDAFVLVNDWKQDAYFLRLTGIGKTVLSGRAGSSAVDTEDKKSEAPRSDNARLETKSSGAAATQESGVGLAPADFATRCTASAALVCEGFDDPVKFRPATYPASGLYPDGGGQIKGTQDTTIKASGAGSLRFVIDSHTGANVAGAWRQGFTRNFGAHSTFYVQYRLRMSPEMLNQNWGDNSGHTSWKIAIFHYFPKTCGDVELTTTNYYNSGVAIMYTDCGGRGLYTNDGKPPYLRQQGETPKKGYNCAYGSDANCFRFVANTWMTLYYRVSIGDWGKPNSSVDAWVGLPGQPLKQWINVHDFALNNDKPGSDYDSLDLLNYMTGKDPKLDHPQAFTWYDELIVSGHPIAPPK